MPDEIEWESTEFTVKGDQRYKIRYDPHSSQWIMWRRVSPTSPIFTEIGPFSSADAAKKAAERMEARGDG